MHPGIIGGIVGAVIGFAGGLVGTYFSIRSASGPKERAFVIRAAVTLWVAISSFLLLLFLLPHPWRYLLWVPYGVFLPLAIIYWNKRQTNIRKEEGGERLTI